MENQENLPSQDFSSKVPEEILPVPSANLVSPVVVSTSSKLSWWFYVLFVLVFFAFLGMTYLLYQTLSTQKVEETTISPTPTFFPQVISPTFVFSPTPLATDSALLQLKETSSSDELEEIERDLLRTDFSLVEEATSSLP